MGITDGESESDGLLQQEKIPSDTFHLAYIIYLILGAGYLLPWNTFITAVDYFSYLYPDASIDRVFAVAYMLVELISVLIIIASANRSNTAVRINVGYALFLAALLTVPLLDVWYVKGRVGVYGAYYVTVGVVAMCGLADGLVQGGVVGNASQLPQRYMQAQVAGNAASGVLVSLLRILTKAIYPQDASGLRKGANLYFIFSIVVMLLNIIFCNAAQKLPIIKYYNDLKTVAANEEKGQKGELTGKLWRSTLWEILGTVKWYGYGIMIIFVVSFCIFPGSITEDVHSDALKDWFPIVLITGYNLFDLIGKSLTPLYLMENAKAAIGAAFARLLFLPLFYGCLHGPDAFRTEIPVMILTCLLGLTNGYFTSVLMILAPKSVQLQHAQTAGIVVVWYLITGIAIGSILSWFWVL